MRIGLIADIHGNAAALDVVMAAIERSNVDRVVCLGDVAVLGPEPKRVLDRLRRLGCDCVRGNTDAWLLDEPSDAEEPSPGPVADLLDWTRNSLDAADLGFVAGFIPYVEVNLLAGVSLLCAHGSPRSFEDVIAPATPPARVLNMFEGFDPTLAAGGHTHIQLFRRFGRMGFINPGSVGLPGVGPNTPDLPVNRAVDWAEYAIIEADEGGSRIELCRVPLDIEEMVRIAGQTRMPHLDWWRARWA